MNEKELKEFREVLADVLSLNHDQLAELSEILKSKKGETK